MIVRDLMTGKKRFSEFLESPERITTNILADRLARMEAAGLVTKTAYQERPVRHDYALTEMGEELRPALQQICKWSNLHIPGTWTPPKSFMRRKA